MRVRSGIVEFDSKEAAHVLGIPEENLIEAVGRGDFLCWYRLNNRLYFNEASIDTNREILQNIPQDAKQLMLPGIEG